MMMAAIFLATTVAPGFGAMYPGGVPVGSPGHVFCSIRYKFTTADPIDAVATFYARQAKLARVALLNDSAAKFADYRTLVFVQQPKFLSVTMSRTGGRTTAQISFHVAAEADC